MSRVWRDSISLKPLPDGEFAGWPDISSDVFVVSASVEKAQAAIEAAAQKLSFSTTCRPWECGTKPPVRYWMSWFDLKGLSVILEDLEASCGSKEEATKEFEMHRGRDLRSFLLRIVQSIRATICKRISRIFTGRDARAQAFRKSLGDDARKLKEEDAEKERRGAELAKSRGRVVFADPADPFRFDDRPTTLLPGIEDTPGLVEVLSLAKSEANRLGSELIRPGHYLLGIARRGNCLAARILGDLGVDIGRLRDAVDRVLTPPEESVISSRMAFQSKPAERVLALTTGLAGRMGRGYRGTEHLLLALVEQDVLREIEAVREFDLSFATVRERILNLYEGPMPVRERRYPGEMIVNPG